MPPLPARQAARHSAGPWRAAWQKWPVCGRIDSNTTPQIRLVFAPRITSLGQSATKMDPSAPVSLFPDDVAALRARLCGRLLEPGDDGYDNARLVWNGMIDRRPKLIAGCAGPADVIESVDFARRHGLTLSVRGGGHNVAGYAVCDGGLMIDLSAMRAVRVD